MMTLDPVTGPMPREKLQEAIEAPFGGAKKILRAYDPLWGVQEGEKIKWEVRVSRCSSDEGTAYVEASSKEEAEELSDDLEESDIQWDSFGEGFEILSVEPAK